MNYFILLSLFPLLSLAQNDQDSYLLEHHQYEKGSTQYLFGDHVVLRESPSKEARSIDTLVTGAAVKIVEQSETYTRYGGMDWPWYKVKAGKKTGYVLGALISFPIEQDFAGRYLVSMKHDEEKATALYRYLTEDGQLLQGEADLNTWKFNVEVSNNHGIEGLESMLYIDYYAEACGVDGGGIYIFNDGRNLSEAIQLSSVVEAGLFWYSEELIFPDDEKGMEGAIVFRREHGEIMDEEMNWTEIQTTLFTLHWGDGKLYPEIPPMRNCE